VTAVDAPLDDGIRSALYLTCAEALTNVAKHAAASSVQIVARPGSDGMFELEVVDDGVGGATCTAGSGLAGVHERIASVSGRVELTSPQGSGTRLVVRVPVGHPS
jgi:signal transduction histidine kinase